MPKYLLVCSCGSPDFEYDGSTFICIDCDEHINEADAGFELMAEEDV